MNVCGCRLCNCFRQLFFVQTEKNEGEQIETVWTFVKRRNNDGRGRKINEIRVNRKRQAK